VTTKQREAHAFRFTCPLLVRAQVSIQNCLDGGPQTLLLYNAKLRLPLAMAFDKTFLLSVTHHLALRFSSLYLQQQKGTMVYRAGSERSANHGLPGNWQDTAHATEAQQSQ
jgi:hypothetical protein